MKNIPLYRYIILFFHLSLDGPMIISTFWLLLYIRVQVFVWIYPFISIGSVLIWRSRDHMVTPCLIWGAARVFSKVASPFYISPSRTLISPHPHPSYSWWPSYEMWSSGSLGFWFAFPWWLRMLNIFSWVFWPFVYLLWWNLHFLQIQTIY